MSATRLRQGFGGQAGMSHPPSMTISAALLEECAAELGLSLTGFLSAEEARKALREHRAQLSKWQEAGYAGEMEFMRRAPELLTDPGDILAGMQSVVCFVVPYDDRTDPIGPPEVPHGMGRVARYARGIDYHIVIKEKLSCFVQSVREKLSLDEDALRARFFSDAVPLLERSLSSAAGLGFAGKNTLLIRPGLGSFFFLAELLWNAEISGSGTVARSRRSDHFQVLGESGEQSGCGSCRSCMDCCPTGAIAAPGTLDARRCISYLTIEKRGRFSAEEREMLGSWIFGCDVCQEVCPYNQAVPKAPVKVMPEFRASAGAGAFLSIDSVLQIRSEAEFRLRFARTPLLRTRRSGLLRNAAAVAANTGYTDAVPRLRELAAGDPSETVRAQARDSLSVLLP